MTKIDAFAHILPPSYGERLEALTAGQVSDRILGYRPWIREDPALLDLDARWRTIDPFGDYRQILTLAVPPVEELGGPAVALDLATAANDELAALVTAHPDRFAGFTAAQPMGDPQAAAALSGCTRPAARCGRTTRRRPRRSTASGGRLAGPTRPRSRWRGWSTRAASTGTLTSR